MAKGRRSSRQSTRKLNIEANHNGVNGRSLHWQPGQSLESNDSIYPTQISEEGSTSLPVDVRTNSLYTEIDSSNRVFLLKNESTERVECYGFPSGLAATYRQHIMTSADKGGQEENNVEVTASSADQNLAYVEKNPEYGMLTVKPQIIEPSREKKRPAPISTSPTKRQRSNFLEQAGSIKISSGIDSRNEVKDEEEHQDDEDDGDDEDEDRDGEFEGATFEKRGLRVCDLDPALEDILGSLYQNELKRLIKGWINTCHPQKQGVFPYNGGREQERKRKAKDPTYNSSNPGQHRAPDYWPPQPESADEMTSKLLGARHKEPDHLLKQERINLCKQLLRAGNRYKDANFDLDKMHKSTISVEKKYPRDFRSSARKFIDSLFYARHKEIEYESGGIDADTIIYLDMNVPPTPRSKRTSTRPYRKRKKPKQSTPELGSFFEFGLPIKPSPPANSSFTSKFNNFVRIESGLTTPLPESLPSAATTSSHATIEMEEIDSQKAYEDSSLFKAAGEGQDRVQHSAEETPDPSEDDTEIDGSDIAPESKNHLNSSNTHQVAISPGSQGEQDAQKLRTLVASKPIVNPFFHGGLLGQQYGNELHTAPTTNQYAVAVRSSPFINTAATTYPHSRSINNDQSRFCNNMPLSPHRAYSHSMQNTSQQPPAGASPFYGPCPPHLGPENLSMAPPQGSPFHHLNTDFPRPITTVDQLALTTPVPQSQPLVIGYPSVASSEFNGAMPADPEWHNYDQIHDDFRDGTYQARRQQAANDVRLASRSHYGQVQQQPQRLQEAHDQRGFNNASIGSVSGVYVNELEDVTRDTQRYGQVVSQSQLPHAQMQGVGLPSPSAVPPGVEVHNHGEIQSTASLYEYPPSLGSRG